LPHQLPPEGGGKKRRGLGVGVLKRGEKRGGIKLGPDPSMLVDVRGGKKKTRKGARRVSRPEKRGGGNVLPFRGGREHLPGLVRPSQKRGGRKNTRGARVGGKGGPEPTPEFHPALMATERGKKSWVQRKERGIRRRPLRFWPEGEKKKGDVGADWLIEEKKCEQPTE